MRWIAAAAVSVAILGGAAAPASAGRVSVTGGKLTYVANPGEANFLFIYPSQIPGYIGVYDEAPVTAG